MAYQSELDKLKTRFEEKPEQWFAALADQYRKVGELDEALRIVRDGIELRPNYVSGHIVHGRCLVDQGEDGEAQGVFEQVLEFDAENIIALRMLGEIAERTGNPEDAQRWLGRLLDVDPMNEEAREILNRIESGGVGIDDAGDEPVDFGGTPDLPHESAPADTDEAEGAGPTVEMTPQPAALAEDEALAEPPAESEPESEDEPSTLEIEAQGAPDDSPTAEIEPPQVEVEEPFDPAEPEPEPEPASEPDPSPTSESESPFVIQQESPFGADEEEDTEPVSFDSVLPENEGGVFGVTEIDFESDKWKRGPSGESEVELPTGDQEVSLDDLPAPAGDSGLPVGEKSISLDDLQAVGSGDSDLPAGDREISLDDIETRASTSTDLPGGERDIELDDMAAAPAAPEAVESSSGADAVEDDATDADDTVETQPLETADPADLAAEATIPDAPALEPEPPVASSESDETESTLVIEAPVVEAPAEAEPDPASEPEPAEPHVMADEDVPAPAQDMVTETLAEVYARQGLTSKARMVYEQLVEANPGDERLRAKLAELQEAEDGEREDDADEPPAAVVPEPEGDQGTPGYLASDTGGVSVRAVLATVLASRPGAPANEPEPESEPVAVATAPAEPTPLERAFGRDEEEEEGDADPDATLASVFEEDEPEAATETDDPEGDNMSFDQFFRTEDGEPAAEEEKSEDDEDFKNWLQGLKS